MTSGNIVAFAAQSTADVPVSDKQKDSALQELLSDNVNKMHRNEKYAIGHGDILSIGLYEEGNMSASAALDQTGLASQRRQQ